MARRRVGARARGAERDRAEVDVGAHRERLQLGQQARGVGVDRNRLAERDQLAVVARGSPSSPARRRRRPASACVTCACSLGDLGLEVGGLLALGRKDQEPERGDQRRACATPIRIVRSVLFIRRSPPRPRLRSWPRKPARRPSRPPSAARPRLGDAAARRSCGGRRVGASRARSPACRCRGDAADRHRVEGDRDLEPGDLRPGLAVARTPRRPPSRRVARRCARRTARRPPRRARSSASRPGSRRRCP